MNRFPEMRKFAHNYRIGESPGRGKPHWLNFVPIADPSPVILSGAKNPCLRREIIRSAQNDRRDGLGSVTLTLMGLVPALVTPLYIYTSFSILTDIATDVMLAIEAAMLLPFVDTAVRKQPGSKPWKDFRGR